MANLIKVSTFTPVESGNPLTHFPASYLAPLFGGREIAVLTNPVQINRDGSQGCTARPYEASCLSTALKIFTYIASAGILPLLALLVTLVIRACNDYHYIDAAQPLVLPNPTPASNSPLERRFDRLYNFCLSLTVQSEWKEAIVVSKNGQTIFSQLEKMSRDKVDNFKNQTIQKIKSALEDKMSGSACEITMMFVEEGRSDKLYSASCIKDASTESTVDIDKYVVRDATKTRVQDLIKCFYQGQVEPLTEFFFSVD